jgi:1-acyl-sn-glycerol-3-phosphate acyltransferase
VSENKTRAMGAWERRARVLLYFLGLTAVCLYTELAFIFWAQGWSLFDPAGRRRRFNVLTSQWGYWLCELTRRVLKARLEVRGEIPPGRFVIVSNHQSTADIAILFWVFRNRNCKFVAKKSLGRGKPAVSRSLRLGGAALIARDPSRADLKNLRDMAASMEAWDGCPAVFAEGTRSRDGTVLPYQQAALRIVAKGSGLPLLPIAIDGTHVAPDLPGFIANMPGSSHLLTIGEPIPVERWRADFKQAVEEMHDWAETTIETDRQGGSIPPPPRAPGDPLETPE